ncbi:type 1 fimbrial protein [Paraburkholderia bengalensis]|uniref:Type 1 fimbrial protein n=1 Tax=Paraburkholderia bengalensis TaxID=2747562 RepID=A0ABU8IVQ2_9BURK
MTMFIACLKRLLLAVALASFATGACARYNDCTAPLPMSVNIPSVGIPANLSNGQAIPGARASFNIPINCTINPGGVWWMTMFAGSFSLVAGYSDVYTAPGLGAGVGFRIRDGSGATMTPVSNSGTINTFQFGAAQLGANVVQGSFELVKTGDAVVGTFSFVTGVHIQNQEWANAGTQSASTLSFNYTITGTAVPTCSVTTTDITVSLPTVSVSAFKGVGATAGTTPFGLSLNCASNAKPSISLTDAAAPSNESNVLTLSAGSTAAGLGVQVLYQMQPLPLGPMSYVYTGGTPVTNVTALGTRSGAASVSFTARYIQTAPSVNPGTVNAVATFTMSYQ